MRARILLIALLLWGPTGSAFCETSCAQPADSAHAAPAALASAPAPAVSPCHGEDGSGSAGMAHAAGSSHASCSCTDADLARPAPPPAAGSVPVASVSLLAAEVPGFRASKRLAQLVVPPDRPHSPYLRHNSPLLI